jgi:hypothetical protein
MALLECEAALDDSAGADWADFTATDAETDRPLARVRHIKGTPAARITCPVRGVSQIRLRATGTGTGEALWFAVRFTDGERLTSVCGGHALPISHNDLAGDRALLLFGGDSPPVRDDTLRLLTATRADAAFWLSETDAEWGKEGDPFHVMIAEPLSPERFTPGLEWAAFTAGAYALPPQYTEVVAAPAGRDHTEALRTAARVISASRNRTGLLSPAVVEPPTPPLTLRETLRWRFAASEEEMASLGVTRRMARRTDVRSFTFWAGQRTDVMLTESVMRSLVPTFCNWSAADASHGRAAALPLLAACLIGDLEDAAR